MFEKNLNKVSLKKNVSFLLNMKRKILKVLTEVKLNHEDVKLQRNRKSHAAESSTFKVRLHRKSDLYFESCFILENLDFYSFPPEILVHVVETCFRGSLCCTPPCWGCGLLLAASRSQTRMDPD